MTNNINSTKKLLNLIVKSIQEMKGIEIISLDLRKIETSICIYFIICTGNSNTHVNAISLAIKKDIRKELKEKHLHTEGRNAGEWIQIDNSYIIVHIFQENIRKFYNIEEFWGDANSINYKAN